MKRWFCKVCGFLRSCIWCTYSHSAQCVALRSCLAECRTCRRVMPRRSFLLSAGLILKYQWEGHEVKAQVGLEDWEKKEEVASSLAVKSRLLDVLDESQNVKTESFLLSMALQEIYGWKFHSLYSRFISSPGAHTPAIHELQEGRPPIASTSHMAMAQKSY